MFLASTILFLVIWHPKHPKKNKCRSSSCLTVWSLKSNISENTTGTTNCLMNRREYPTAYPWVNQSSGYIQTIRHVLQSSVIGGFSGNVHEILFRNPFFHVWSISKHGNPFGLLIIDRYCLTSSMKIAAWLLWIEDHFQKSFCVRLTCLSSAK